MWYDKTLAGIALLPRTIQSIDVRRQSAILN